METCTVETGLLKKKPCGHNAVTHCANCEQALCKDHAVPQKSEAGRNSGKFMCKECTAAHKEIAKNPPPAMAKKPAEAAKPGAPGAAPAAAPGAAKQAPKEEAKTVDDGGALEFTPSKK